LEIGKYLRKFI